MANQATQSTLIHVVNFFRKWTVTSTLLFLPLRLREVGFSGIQIGMAVSVLGLAPLIFSFPVGWLNDRISIKKVIQSALFLLALIFAMLGLATRFPAVLFLILLLGVANNALDVSLNNLNFKEESGKDLNRKYGHYVFWLFLGVACGTLFGGVLIHRFSFNVLFIVYAAIMALVLALSTRLQDEKTHWVTIREYVRGLAQKKIVRYILVMFILALHWGVEGTVYSPFLKEYFGLNMLQIALYMALPLFPLSFSAFLLGMWQYNVRLNRRLFLLSMALSGLGHVFMVIPVVGLSFAFRIVHEIGDGFIGALNVLFISRLFEKKSIGGSSGLFGAVVAIGNMIGALVFSSIGYKIGLQYPFIISGVLLLANVALTRYVFSRETY